MRWHHNGENIEQVQETENTIHVSSVMYKKGKNIDTEVCNENPGFIRRDWRF